LVSSNMSDNKVEWEWLKIRRKPYGIPPRILLVDCRVLGKSWVKKSTSATTSHVNRDARYLDVDLGDFPFEMVLVANKVRMEGYPDTFYHSNNGVTLWNLHQG